MGQCSAYARQEPRLRPQKEGPTWVGKRRGNQASLTLSRASLPCPPTARVFESEAFPRHREHTPHYDITDCQFHWQLSLCVFSPIEIRAPLRKGSVFYFTMVAPKMPLKSLNGCTSLPFPTLLGKSGWWSSASSDGAETCSQGARLTTRNTLHQPQHLLAQDCDLGHGPQSLTPVQPP